MKVSRYSLSEISWEAIAPLIGDSFFGSVGFANLWRAIGGKPVYWIAEENGALAAVLPGVEFGFAPFKRFYAMPDGCYGRLFFADSHTDNKEAVATSCLDALSKAGYVKTYIYDFYACLPAYRGFVGSNRHTTLVDVSSPGWQPPERNIRQEIRKAVREGIHIEKFNLVRHFSQFLHLVKVSERRIGCKCTFSTEFFKALAALAEEDKRVQWVWSEHNGQVVSSHIFLVEHDNLLFWQMYFEKTLTFLKPNQYVPFVTAKRLAREGVKWLNFGASPENAPGVVFYKKKWGGKPYSYNCYVMRRGLGKFL